MLYAAASILLVLAFFYAIFFVFFPIARGAVFYPSTQAHASHMAELAAVSYGDRAADLGSGDGRVVIALAAKGAECHGYEINPVLVLLSRHNVRKAGLAGRAHIHWGSFWRVDLSPFQAVTVFQGSFVMPRLERKVLREMSEHTRVVSDFWRFPHLKPEGVFGTTLLYRVGAHGLMAGR